MAKTISKLVKSLSTPLGGVVGDKASTVIGDTDLTDASNIRYLDNILIKRTGYSQFGTGLPLNGTVMAFDEFTKYSGTSYPLVITNRDVYKYRTTQNDFQFITEAYVTGTVAVTQGSATIVGTDTLWSTNITVGDKFRLGGMNDSGAVWYTVSSITDDTHIVLTVVYAGANATAQAYTIRQLLTAADSDLVSYEQFIDLFIFTNGIDNIKKWTGTGANIADLAGSPPLARYMKGFKNYLVLGHTTETGTVYPQRIRWSNTAAAETWNSGNAGYNTLIEGADWIKGMEILRDDYLAIYKEWHIYVATPVSTSEVFNLQVKITGIGLAAPKSLCSVGDYHIFLSENNVYSFDGINAQSIGDVIQTKLFADLNYAQIGRCFSVWRKENQEYWLYYPSTQAPTYPDKAYVYNTKTKKWLPAKFNDYLTSYGAYTTQTSVSWDDMSGGNISRTWDSMQETWDSNLWAASSPITLIGDKDGYIYKYDASTVDEDGVAIDGSFSTKDFNFGNASIMKDIMGMEIYAKGGTLVVDYSINGGTDWINISTVTLNSSEFARKKVDCRISCEKIRFRFRNSVLGETFQFRNYNIFFFYRGRVDA